MLNLKQERMLLALEFLEVHQEVQLLIAFLRAPYPVHEKNQKSPATQSEAANLCKTTNGKR